MPYTDKYVLLFSCITLTNSKSTFLKLKVYYNIMIMKELSEHKLATESKIKYEYKIQVVFRKNVLAYYSQSNSHKHG